MPCARRRIGLRFARRLVARPRLAYHFVLTRRPRERDSRSLSARRTLPPCNVDRSSPPRAWRSPPDRPSAAEPGPVLVELFTSQGCSSCPRADAALARLVDRADVLPLAFHVTYWDRLGWRDTLGNAEFDQRQRWYAGLLGTGAYTPQAVVAGEIDLVGSDPRLEDALEIARTRRMPARIEFAGDLTRHAAGNRPDGRGAAGGDRVRPAPIGADRAW